MSYTLTPSNGGAGSSLEASNRGSGSLVRDNAGALPEVRRRALDRLMLLLKDRLDQDTYSEAEDLIAEAFNEADWQVRADARAPGQDRAYVGRTVGDLMRQQEMAADAAMTDQNIRSIQTRFPGLHLRRG